MSPQGLTWTQGSRRTWAGRTPLAGPSGGHRCRRRSQPGRVVTSEVRANGPPGTRWKKLRGYPQGMGLPSDVPAVVRGHHYAAPGSSPHQPSATPLRTAMSHCQRRHRGVCEYKDVDWKIQISKLFFLIKTHPG
ncbi:hypothetical protein HJG60_009973 [Phyllostomus discolor]|uniref:Uncharacterized protein n=1 Tax=Phyllostomus discolor TaxID=89673 RepID=A0A834ELL2_9CHIR|nr:hypothetical protein HJG60_009973 [Phyllostomus discolor]